MHLSTATIIAYLYGFSVSLVDGILNRHPGNTYPNDVESAILSANAVEREIRAVSMVVRGMAAQRKLLLGSKAVPVNSKTYRRFEKTGDFETAMKEFYSVKPTNVREKKSYSLRVVSGNNQGRVLTGNVGNRRLLLKEWGEDGHPCLEVIETKFEPGPYIDMIVYKLPRN